MYLDALVFKLIHECVQLSKQDLNYLNYELRLKQVHQNKLQIRIKSEHKRNLYALGTTVLR
jgi:hypothetical protein